MQATQHFSLIDLSVGRRHLSYQNARQVGFAAGQVEFHITCPAGRVAVEIFFEACLILRVNNL